MQRGIDSFFKKITPAAKKFDDPESPAPVKRKARVIISSDEDEVPESPQLTGKAKEQQRKKSRNDEKSPAVSGKGKKTTPPKPKALPKPELKRIDPMAMFGGSMVRVEAKKPPKPKEAGVIELEDDEMDQSIMAIDVDKSLIEAQKKEKNGIIKKASVEEPTESPIRKEKQEKKSPRKDDKKQEKEKHSPCKKQEGEKQSPKAAKVKQEKEKSSRQEKAHTTEHSKSEEKKEQVKEEMVKQSQVKQENITPTSAKKHKLETVWKEQSEKTHTPSVKKEKKEKSTPRAKTEHVDLESSVLSDEERHERKRASAMLYQKFKNRASVINPGSKDVPKGKPNCLAGLTFLVTGVLESLERDETASIIKEYGGKMMTVVGKRLNYLIVGEEAGPKKLAQAEDFNIPILSEDGFLDLIRSKSGQATKGESNPIHDDDKPSTSPKVKKEKDAEESVNATQNKSEKSLRKAEEQNNNETKIEKVKLSPVENETIEYTHSPKQEISEDMLAWVDKYKPTSVKEIIGQQGAASNVTKLTNWLSKWYINHDGKKKLQKPNPWAKNDDGSYFKAALLSGPPGIGKTTTATLVCKELGFDAVEFNASDTRSKRLLKEEVSELLSNKSLYGYFHGNAQAVTKKHALIMDEVDGMAGNEDRGGIQELIGLIKDSSVPIICMCNDRNHQKMRSLVNYCYDLRFSKPRLEQIKGRVMSICFREKIKLSPAKIEEIIAATNNDIRQSINHISLLGAGRELNLKSDEAKSTEKIAQKDLKIGPWEVVRKVFSADEHKHMSIYDKSDLFFHDYSMAPLFVQQNYLQVSPAGPKSEVLQKVALTADALSLGDLVEKRIRSSNAWTLLPTQAAFCSIMPGEYMSGYFTGQINFPGWLGKNSRSTKRKRLAQEIHDHTRLRTSGSRLSIRMDYAPFLLANIVRPLKEQGLEGVESSLAVIKEYHLLREDLDALIELTTWPGKKGPMDAVDGRVKAALTRAYNKEVMAYTYSAAAGVKKKRAEAAEAESELKEGDEEGEAVAVASDEEKDDDNLENDGLIKAKKKPASTAKASTSKASNSKAAATKKPTASKPKTASKSKK